MQELITYIIIGIATIYAIYLFTKRIRKKVKKADAASCDGCATTDCGGCELLELKKEIEAAKKGSK